MPRVTKISRILGKRLLVVSVHVKRHQSFNVAAEELENQSPSAHLSLKGLADFQLSSKFSHNFVED